MVHHGRQDRQHLAPPGRQGDLCGCACGAPALLQGFAHRMGPHGDHGTPGQGSAHGGASAPDGAAAPQGATVARAGGYPSQGGAALAARAAPTARWEPPGAARPMRVGCTAWSRTTRAAIPGASWRPVQRAPGGRTAIARWAVAPSRPPTQWRTAIPPPAGPPLQETGSGAPGPCAGSGSPGRDAPRSAPVSADPRRQRSLPSGSRMRGMLPRHPAPVKIQGYRRSLARVALGADSGRGSAQGFPPPVVNPRETDSDPGFLCVKRASISLLYPQFLRLGCKRLPSLSSTLIHPDD